MTRFTNFECGALVFTRTSSCPKLLGLIDVSSCSEDLVCTLCSENSLTDVDFYDSYNDCIILAVVSLTADLIYRTTNGRASTSSSSLTFEVLLFCLSILLASSLKVRD